MAKIIIKILLISLLITSSSSKDVDWISPYFMDADEIGVEFSYIESTGLAVLNVEEELSVPFKLLIINYPDDDEAKPKIGKFSVGDFNLLGATIVQENSSWYIQINDRQDYERPEQQQYQFEVFISTQNGEQSMTHTVIIKLINIFDNKPTITYNGPCKSEELQTNIPTNCTFNVYDVDGMLGNEIQMNIIEKDHENEYFSFVRGKEDAYHVEYNLTIIKELQYDYRALYNLNITATDIANNMGFLATIFVVINVPHKPPIWVQSLVTETFDEKTEQTFMVSAIDGDTGINQPICYRVEFLPDQDYSDIIEINEENGTLQVSKIDRDARKQETYQFYTCAFKCFNITSELCSISIFIVMDVNDNLPEITILPNQIQIPENQSLTLPLQTFQIEDIDLATHATFNVILSDNQNSNGGIEYSKAFDVIPKTGYQNASFQLVVFDKNYLDYELSDWMNFEITIIASETYFPERFTTKKLKIELMNWNDEIPIFQKNIYNTSLLETVGKNVIIENVLATDRDIGDKVIHEIIGNIYGIGIFENGTVYTTADNAFDYERLQVVMIQIKATDTLQTNYSSKFNQAITQLTINVIDVNDKTPEIRMPKTPPNITENSIGNTLVTDLILATDPDTTADLVFEIDWEKSYAMKAGREADKHTYQNCFIIEAHPTNRNNVSGHLKVNPEFQLQVDYEKYENIYLLIRVTDLNQEINEKSAEGTLTVTVDDVNDNPPEFIGDTLTENRFVIEAAAPNTLVGSILAEDIDGPGNNEITYNIEPINGTLPDLVDIESTTGILRVMKNAKIECDLPKIYYLEYMIILTDGVHVTKGNIQVNINDINNKIPEIGDFENPVAIYENATTGTYVGYINATDDDRDEPHNVLEYYINYMKYPELEKFFKVGQENGEIYVQLRADQELDRDNGILFHDIQIDISDNFRDPKNGAKNSNSATLKVILLDVNDNSPEMPKPNDFLPTISESAEINDIIKDPQLIAPDKDEPNHPNSWVSYQILNIQPGENCSPDIENYANLFGIQGDDKVYGEIYANKMLRGYYGSWYVHIEACDHGTEPKQQCSNETYIVEVIAYNFDAPKIIFPLTSQIIRLSHKQTIGRPLYTTDGTQLQSFEAFDPDGREFGNVTFEISSNGNDNEYFRIIQETRNKSQLQIIKTVETSRFYLLNLLAKDGGGKTSELLKNLSIVFIDMEGDPIFEIENLLFTTNFTETELGLEEIRAIPEAKDPKNEGIINEEDLLKIYYFIDYKYNPEHADYFQLESETGNLMLRKILNRTEIDLFEIRIIATNNKDKPSTNPSPSSILLTKITVNDVNNNPPRFDERKYGTGITSSDYIGKEIIKVHAYDPDLDDPTTYLMNETIIAHGENIEDIKKKIFQLHNATGSIRLMMKPLSNMKGYFEFNITAIDTANHTDEANVKIYIIAEVNRVAFTFLNQYSVVKENEIFLRETLEQAYGYDRCNIDDIINSTEFNRETNVTNELVTVRVHFIKNNEAIEAIEIKKKLDYSPFISNLRKTLGQKALILDDVEDYETPEKETNLLFTMLIVISVALAILSSALVVALVLKTKKANRQLRAFKPAEFGSTASNLNRIGAPNTNVFSAEGSNPVINNINLNNDFETSSVDSDDSDFVGINNDPNFMKSNENSSKNSSVISKFEDKNRNSIKNDEVEQRGTNGYIRNLSSTMDLRF